MSGALLALLIAASPAGAARAAAPDDLVDATSVVPGLVLDVRYATANNFVGRPLYGAAKCLLRRAVADRLARAQAQLLKQGLRIVAWDCYRPRSIQQALWDAKPVRGLVAPPSAGGSNHNRGAAVDVGLVRADGTAVALPTDFDDFTPAAWARAASTPPEPRKNRERLQAAMTAAGFKTIRMEWWHFDDPDALGYRSLDVPIR